MALTIDTNWPAQQLRIENYKEFRKTLVHLITGNHRCILGLLVMLWTGRQISWNARKILIYSRTEKKKITLSQLLQLITYGATEGSTAPKVYPPIWEFRDILALSSMVELFKWDTVTKPANMCIWRTHVCTSFIFFFHSSNSIIDKIRL